MSPILSLSLQQLQQFYIDVIPLHRHLGMQMVGCEAGRLLIDLPYSPKLAISADRPGLHEGAITSLIDTACGSVVLTMQDSIRRSATLDLRIDFLRAAAPGASVRCEAQCFDFSDNLAFIRASAYDDSASTPIAVALGSFAVFRGGSGENLIAEALRTASSLQADPLPDQGVDSYVRMLGFESQIDENGALGRMVFSQPVVGNPPLGALHGGAVAGLLQLTAAAELKRQTGDGSTPRLFNFTAEYLRPNLSVDTLARATVVSRSKRFANVRVAAYQDEGVNTAVATAQFLLV